DVQGIPMHKYHREEIGQSSETMITTCPGGCLLLLISILLSDLDCLKGRSLTQSSQQLQHPSSELKASIIKGSDEEYEEYLNHLFGDKCTSNPNEVTLLFFVIVDCYALGSLEEVQ
ncbi:hypothetical protein Tco_1148903, partial [Tanacetum coccineum]